MTSNENIQDDPNALYPMRHPDLGDVLQIPGFAVPLREEMGYEHVADDEGDDTSVPTPEAVDPVEAANPRPARQIKASESAPAPSSDGGPAATPAG